jgi:4-hydroxy-3-methylbut-2-enyl diphosphate reductase
MFPFYTPLFSKHPMKTIPIQTTLSLANPRGFCAGVDRAIAIVDNALSKFGAPIYVRHEVVHNRFVVEGLRKKGAIFIEALSEVPEGATLIYSAHGVPLSVRQEAQTRGLLVFDATCPLVTKVHLEVKRLRKDLAHIVMIGHKGHPEVEGTMGQAEGHMTLVETVADIANLTLPEGVPLAYVTQTTLSIDETRDIIAALKQRYPAVLAPKKEDICYATQNRQDAVKTLAAQCDLVIVVGSPNSSNSNRLRELAENLGVTAFMVDNAAELQSDWFIDKQHIGVTAGASAPEILVQSVINRIQELGVGDIQELAGVEEDVRFALPAALRMD